jgi:hypothetical protein
LATVPVGQPGLQLPFGLLVAPGEGEEKTLHTHLAEKLKRLPRIYFWSQEIISRVSRDNFTIISRSVQGGTFHGVPWEPLHRNSGDIPSPKLMQNRVLTLARNRNRFSVSAIALFDN